ncbi:hypothetical protein EKD02_09585 [Chlorobium phaeovibrioides]|uniref:Uncharacterized protein n=1 Tax=Chlorobium phaeovibrioides TaxID=1094 RepID=A0A3S0NI22_CHLPH|nr:TIGR04326 family surface carbohydrate biosynthesis protein [Chlorobium phaeovibrioides]RTY34917.1 hypothetical protein EKD02_09585 [Chlorobium phaeovibrioides]
MPVGSESLPRVLTIWDCHGIPGNHKGPLVLWRSYGEDSCPDAVSIPQWIEENADSLRERYLAWVYELGQVKVQGRRLVDFLEIRPGFSYWWMAPIAEKCNFSKSPHITDAVRLMAFNDWFQKGSVDRIRLVSGSMALSQCLASWAAQNGWGFEWERVPGNCSEGSLLKKLFRRSPQRVQGLLSFLRYLSRRWTLRGVGIKEWRNTQADTTFISYLFNLVPSALQGGRYECRFWGNLPDVLKEEEKTINWLHLYVADRVVPDSKSAADLLAAFNSNERALQVHATLDSFLGLQVVIRTLLDWLVLWLKWRKVHGSIGRQQLLAGCDVSPLYADEWRSALLGSGAVSNLLTFNLLSAAFRILPKQRLGFYLQENQPWEMALIYAWKEAGHGEIVGVPHSTVRYWDLRYFNDQRLYSRGPGNRMPLPDRVAVNGPVMHDIYRVGGYPEDQLCEAEALRYLYLAEGQGMNEFHRKELSGLRLLVLGDYLEQSTRYMMTLLEGAFHDLPEDMRIVVKPHPACPVEPSEYPSMVFDVVSEPIEKLLQRSDIAYTGAMTSAAVDAYCAGVPVVSVLDQDSLNLSPLRDMDAVKFVSSSRDLVDALVTIAGSSSFQCEAELFFYLDKALPRWKALLTKP